MRAIALTTLISLLCMIMAGCGAGHSNGDTTVGMIEQLVDSARTNEAAAMIAAVNIDNLSKEQRARLTIQKCRLAEINSYAISNAEDLTEAAGVFHDSDPASEAQAKYYIALSAYMAGNFSDAIIEAAEAAEISAASAETVSGCYAIISLCHEHAMNYASALAFAKMSLSLTPDNMATVDLNIDALNNAGQYGECLELIDSYKQHFPELERKAITPAIETGDYERAATLFERLEADSIALSREEILSRAKVMAALGKLAANDEILDEPKPDEQYGLAELRLLDDLQTMVGNDRKVAEIRLMMHNMQDSVITMLSESKIYQDLYNREHVRRQEEIDSARRARGRLLMTIAGILIAALTLIAIMLYRRAAAAKRLAESENRIFALNEELNKGRQEHEHREMEIAGMSERVNKLFKEHYESVEMAANLLIDASLSKNSDKKIADRLSQKISKCRSKEFLETLESTVNEYRNDAIKRIDSQIPGITGQDRVILLYSAAGLSARVISLLTDQTPSSLYNRKYRLKKKIVNSGAKDADEFIDLIR